MRADHSSGLFFKGFAGAGSVVGGNLKDEDFPPFIQPYSATSSDQKDGTIGYASADFGFDFLNEAQYRLGAFVGYHYYHEVVNAYGCNQIGSNPGVCGAPSITDSTLTITNDSKWYSTRLGLVGDIRPTQSIKLSAEIAWLPHTELNSYDSHWLRIKTPGGFSGPQPEDGTGHNGIQLESALAYQLTPSFSIGLGARYWRTETKGHANFQDVVVGGQPQPLNYKMERYGSFVQALFTF